MFLTTRLLASEQWLANATGVDKYKALLKSTDAGTAAGRQADRQTKQQSLGSQDGCIHTYIHTYIHTCFLSKQLTHHSRGIRYAAVGGVHARRGLRVLDELDGEPPRSRAPFFP
jgi:hypothetical protein